MRKPALQHCLMIETMPDIDHLSNRIRWCLTHFGSRGGAWDFNSRVDVTIEIYCEKAATFYALAFSEDAEEFVE